MHAEQTARNPADEAVQGEVAANQQRFALHLRRLKVVRKCTRTSKVIDPGRPGLLKLEHPTLDD